MFLNENLIADKMVSFGKHSLHRRKATFSINKDIQGDPSPGEPGLG